MTCSRASLFCTAALLATMSAAAWADATPQPTKQLPQFSLRDPHGTPYTNDELLRRGTMIIVTAPTLAEGDKQSEWEKYLGAHWQPDGPVLVLVEDMTQSWFPETALSRMREEYRSGRGLLMLIDDQGRLRAALGTEEGETCVLAYARGGRLVHAQMLEPTAKRAAQAWAALHAANRAVAKSPTTSPSTDPSTASASRPSTP